jgi:Type VI secretion system effector, Hcp
MSRKSSFVQTCKIAGALSLLLLSSTAWAAVVNVHVNVPIVHPKIPVVNVKPNMPKIAITTGSGSQIGSQSSGAGKVTFNPVNITRKLDTASPNLFKNATGGTAKATLASSCKLCGRKGAIVGGAGATIAVEGNRSETVGGAGATITVGGNRNETIGGAGATIVIEGNRSETIGSAGATITVEGNRNEMVGGAGATIAVEGNRAETVGGAAINLGDPLGPRGDIDHPVVIGSVWNGGSLIVGGTRPLGGKAPAVIFPQVPVVLFNWGPPIAPVRITALSVSEEGYDATLSPIQAQVQIPLGLGGSANLLGGTHTVNWGDAGPVGGNVPAGVPFVMVGGTGSASRNFNIVGPVVGASYTVTLSGPVGGGPNITVISPTVALGDGNSGGTILTGPITLTGTGVDLAGGSPTGPLTLTGTGVDPAGGNPTGPLILTGTGVGPAGGNPTGPLTLTGTGVDPAGSNVPSNIGALGGKVLINTGVAPTGGNAALNIGGGAIGGGLPTNGGAGDAGGNAVNGGDVSVGGGAIGVK